MNVFEEIAAERLKQLNLGYDYPHDDKHTEGELAMAAVCYAAPVPVYREGVQDPWPFEPEYDKRIKDRQAQPIEDRQRELIKAAALIVAEIERLNRM